MTGRAAIAGLSAAALLAVASGCGGGDKQAAEPLPKAPTLTVPGETATPSVPKRAKTSTETTATDTSTATSTSTATTTAPQSNPSTPAGGAAPPQNGGATADTPQNDQAPPNGSPAQKFEEFCKDNPGAC